MKTKEQILEKITELKKHITKLDKSIDYNRMGMDKICGIKDTIVKYEVSIMYLEWVLNEK